MRIVGVTTDYSSQRPSHGRRRISAIASMVHGTAIDTVCAPGIDARDYADNEMDNDLGERMWSWCRKSYSTRAVGQTRARSGPLYYASIGSTE
jgi:hypothetical protein